MSRGIVIIVGEAIISNTLGMWQTPVLCVTLNGQFFHILGSDTRLMCRFSDLVWADLSLTKGVGSDTSAMGFCGGCY